jgi:hypothetical protein
MFWSPGLQYGPNRWIAFRAIYGRDAPSSSASAHTVSHPLEAVLHYSKNHWSMSALGLGCAKTQSDLIVMPCRRRIFAFACTARDHRPQNYWCVYTAWRFHTARVISLGGDWGRGPVYVRSASNRVEILCTAVKDAKCRFCCKSRFSTADQNFSRPLVRFSDKYVRDLVSQ